MSQWWYLIAVMLPVVAFWGTRWLVHPDHKDERMAFFSRRPRPRAAKVEAGKPRRIQSHRTPAHIADSMHAKLRQVAPPVSLQVDPVSQALAEARARQEVARQERLVQVQLPPLSEDGMSVDVTEMVAQLEAEAVYLQRVLRLT